MTEGTSPEAPVIVTVVAPHVALVTLNRAEARNAVNAEMAQALDGVVKRTEADPDIRAVILAGAGEQVFCAGADLKEIAAGKGDLLWTPDGGFAGFAYAQRSKVWIAAVHGLALAGGCEIALACDMIVAADTAAFGLPEVTRGLIASAGGLYRLPRALPRVVALEMIATGARLDARRAYELGMVNRLVPVDQVGAAAVALATTISGNAPIAVRESLTIARQAVDLTDVELRQLSRAARRRIMATADYREGPRAFIERRAPKWTGQ
ncbi:MAG TPA: enoyl-CoA hydratase-related protein [Stellaceae bacterium]|nr:enoyl-CoA hydratase-related protein [Stellaceae bacterium]